MKICQLEFCQLYSDPFNKFDDHVFDELNGLKISPQKICQWAKQQTSMVSKLIALTLIFKFFNIM